MQTALDDATLEDRAIRAATSALEECDHSRLPVGVVAQIAVNSARAVLREEWDNARLAAGS